MSVELPAVRTITVSASRTQDWQKIADYVRIQFEYDIPDGGRPTKHSPYKDVWRDNEFTDVIYGVDEIGNIGQFFLHNFVHGKDSPHDQHKHYPEFDKPALYYDPSGFHYRIEVLDAQGHFSKPQIQTF